jgi:hypothetical protein
MAVVATSRAQVQAARSCLARAGRACVDGPAGVSSVATHVSVELAVASASGRTLP